MGSLMVASKGKLRELHKPGSEQHAFHPEQYSAQVLKSKAMLVTHACCSQASISGTPLRHAAVRTLRQGGKEGPAAGGGRAGEGQSRHAASRARRRRSRRRRRNNCRNRGGRHVEAHGFAELRCHACEEGRLFCGSRDVLGSRPVLGLHDGHPHLAVAEDPEGHLLSRDKHRGVGGGEGVDHSSRYGIQIGGIAGRADLEGEG
mmetsp:Transcript_50293/g.159194  ORF Transcript_50293/g.159194 Transcript_50293/m.159194 type:complete len:203 (-) Transcript_50293:38-646(-)